MTAELDPGGSRALAPTELGRLFGRSRWWARDLLREWWEEQQAGGPLRVFRRGTRLLTTAAVVDRHLPRRADPALERRLRGLERGVDEAYRRISELERRIGRRR